MQEKRYYWFFVSYIPAVGTKKIVAHILTKERHAECNRSIKCITKNPLARFPHTITQLLTQQYIPCKRCVAKITNPSKIKREIRESMLHHKDMTPLECTNTTWLYAFGPDDNLFTNYGGKWMLFISPEFINEVWSKIRIETEKGNLGCSSKVKTALGQDSQDSRVICIYTYDCRDMDDIIRVLKRLRELDFLSRLNYKEDNATHAGIYENTKIPASLYTSSNGTEIKQLRDIIPFGKNENESK